MSQKKLNASFPVITGIGAYSAGGKDVPTLWEHVLRGEVNASFQELSRTSLCAPVYAAPTPSFAGKEKARLRCADRSSQLALVAAQEAWNQATESSATISSERVGLIVGTARGPVSLQEKNILKTATRPSDSLYSSFSSTAGILSNAFSIEGAALMVSSSCTSGATALQLASQMIRSGELDLVLVGATEAPLVENILEQYHVTGILSKNKIPSKALAPFDQERSGTVLGEGAAFLVLESEESATRRGAAILGCLQAVSIGTQSRHRGGIDPTTLSLEKVLEQSLRQAELKIDEISLLQLHGTGTMANDLAESSVVTSVFGTKEKQPFLCATKAITGHTLGAATLFQVITTLCALRDNIVPKVINCATLDRDCPLRLVLNENISQPLSTGLCLTSGFWGNVASVIVSV